METRRNGSRNDLAKSKTPKTLDSPCCHSGRYPRPSPCVFLGPHLPHSSRGPQMCSLNPENHLGLLAEPDLDYCTFRHAVKIGFVVFYQLAKPVLPSYTHVAWPFPFPGAKLDTWETRFRPSFQEDRFCVSGNTDSIVPKPPVLLVCAWKTLKA
jgi:hypothetical protein